MLKVHDLVVEVENKAILSGVDVEIDRGEVVAVMGPNGSGKSTLAYTLAGHPNYKVAGGAMELDGKELDEMSPDERANLGLFLSMQYPSAIPGLTVNSYLWQLYKKRNHDKNKLTVGQFRQRLTEEAEGINLNIELLGRGLNDGFSGGEKKKLELLQMIIFEPKYVILDEIDSGLDVDALKMIATAISQMVKKNKIGVLVITHYNRLLKFLKADRVVVMSKGQVVRTGGSDVALEIEEKGYENRTR